MNTVLRTLMIILAILALVLPILYRLFDREDKALTHRVREKAGGSYAKLGPGTTHYELSGERSNPLVVLIHGGGPPMWVWDRQIERLHREGYRTLRFDRYGAGYSDRIDTLFSWELLSSQVEELLKHLEIEGPVHVAGRSIGGRVAACFAVENPERIKSLTIVSTSLLSSKNGIGFRIPGMIYASKFVYRVFGGLILKKQMNKYKEFIDSNEKLREYYNLMKEQRRFYGTEDNFFSIFRDKKFMGCPKAENALKDTSHPICLIYGTEDPLVPEKRIEKLKNSQPHIVFRAIENSGHGINFTKAEEFNRYFVSFLNKSEKSDQAEGTVRQQEIN